MSNKCIVKITHTYSPKYRDGETLYLLRLQDGSPADAGADVYRAANRAAHNCYRFSTEHAGPAVHYLRTRLAAAATAGHPPIQLYRRVETVPADIRYFYEIDCPEGYVFINFAQGIGPPLEFAVQPFTPGDLQNLVNDCRRAINDAIANLATVDPYFATQCPYPEIV